MWWPWILGGWTVTALTWWCVAYRMALHPRPTKRPGSVRGACRISIFKPIPRLETREELQWLAESIESFAAQLDEQTEILLGIHEEDRRSWEPFINKWRSKCSPESLKVIFRAESDSYANPKISWQRILARHAGGELWMWSDADILAPPDFLATARSEMLESRYHLLTNAYVVQQVSRPTGLFEALFVNVEFYPGVLLLGRLGCMRFGFGAGMLFGAEDFRHRACWNELGGHLAEDFVLGKRLQPVGLGSSVLNTFSHSTQWREALFHYVRWQKTVRWCRPGGFAAQILILPLVGWAGLIALFRSDWLSWAGFAMAWQLEIAVAYAICRRVGCRISWRHYGIVAGWSVLRAVTWLACWLPWPIRWRDGNWWSLTRRRRRRNDCI